MGHLSLRVKALLDEYGDKMSPKQRAHAKRALESGDPVELEGVIISQWYLTHLGLPPETEDVEQSTQLKLKLD